MDRPHDRHARHQYACAFTRSGSPFAALRRLARMSDDVVALFSITKITGSFPQGSNIERFRGMRPFRLAVTEKSVHNFGFLADLRRPRAPRLGE